MHIQDIVNLLESEDLRDVVLTGHSYGGMVITGVAERASERLSHLVYLDAFVPQDGEASIGYLPEDRRTGMIEGARAGGDGWQVPAPPLGRFGVEDAEDLRWSEPRIVPQPLKTFTQPIALPEHEAETLPRTYVWCKGGYTAGSFAPFAERARGGSGWRYHELETGHDAMITAPNDVARILAELT
jgi:pimeloyl-ACP methyl ester carboxylesterase